MARIRDSAAYAAAHAAQASQAVEQAAQAITQLVEAVRGEGVVVEIQPLTIVREGQVRLLIKVPDVYASADDAAEQPG